MRVAIKEMFRRQAQRPQHAAVQPEYCLDLIQGHVSPEPCSRWTVVFSHGGFIAPSAARLRWHVSYRLINALRTSGRAVCPSGTVDQR